jgi:hypothetical protein
MIFFFHLQQLHKVQNQFSYRLANLRGKCGKGNAEIASRLFFKECVAFKDIFREFEAFLKISILFEDIYREIEAFFN